MPWAALGGRSPLPVPAQSARVSPGCYALSCGGSCSALWRGHRGPLLHLLPPHRPPDAASSAAPAAAEPAAPTSFGGSAARPAAPPEWGDSTHELSQKPVWASQPPNTAPYSQALRPSAPHYIPAPAMKPPPPCFPPTVVIFLHLLDIFCLVALSHGCAEGFQETHSSLLSATKLPGWTSTAPGHLLPSLLHLPWWCPAAEADPGSLARTEIAPGTGTSVGFPLLQGLASAYLQRGAMAEGSWQPQSPLCPQSVSWASPLGAGWKGPEGASTAGGEGLQEKSPTSTASTFPSPSLPVSCLLK